MKEITAYTVGSCFDNPGAGGYAAILQCGKETRHVAGICGEKTTNNRIELLAVVKVLEWINNIQKEPCFITIKTQSAYLCTCVDHTKKDPKWLTSDKRPNGNLWTYLCDLAKAGKHKIQFVKVKAHSGDKLNELCDATARAKAKEAKAALGG